MKSKALLTAGVLLILGISVAASSLSVGTASDACPGKIVCPLTRALGMAREEAERMSGPLTKMPFLITDNGSSFIARRFASFVRNQYRHVRIQYRTPTQLGLLERFHRTLKAEEVHWRLYDDPPHARKCLDEFRTRYNFHRPHWALVPSSGGDPYVPHEVYVGGDTSIQIPSWQTWARAVQSRLDRLMAEAATCA